MLRNAKQFDAGRSNGILESLLGRNSLVLLDGDRHQRQRKLLMPPFHGEKVRSYGDIIAIRIEVRTLITYYLLLITYYLRVDNSSCPNLTLYDYICQITQEVGKQWSPNQPLLASKAMQDITLEVILQAVFGLREGQRYRQLKPLLSSLLDLTGSPLRSSFLFFPWLQQDLGSWSPWGKVVRQRREVYELLQAEIDEKRSQSSITGNDVLSLMLLARDEDGQPMSDSELKDELMTMLIAAVRNYRYSSVLGIVLDT